MKTLWTGIFAGAVLCGISLAQDSASQQNNAPPQGQPSRLTTRSTQPGLEQARGTPRIAPGSVIPVQLTKTIDAKKVRTGDAVEAKVTQDLKAQSGEVVMPKDTKVLGHVTEAQVRSKEQKESQVGIAFDRAVIRNEGEVPLPLSIQAIIAPPTLNRNAASEGMSQPAPAPSAGGASRGNSGEMPTNGSGRSSGMDGTMSPMPASSSAGAESPSGTQTGTDVRQPITGNTQGVVGISNLKLALAANTAQGSLVSSEKSNVKLESGTLMLLRVSQ